MDNNKNTDKLMELLERSPNLLIENNHIEFKKSKKGFPIDALETYSSFANTEGGFLILGVTEIKDNSKKNIEITGVDNPQKTIDEFFDLINNKNKVNKNIIGNEDIFIKDISGKKIVIINVPEVDYKSKPIYLNGSKYNSFKRNHTGDYKCSTEEVDMMIVNSSPISFDSTVQKKFSIDDFDPDTISKYRLRMNNLSNLSPFSEYDDEKFLMKIGALAKDRDNNNEIKPTVAGLLVFGYYRSIRDLLPNYHVEYIDKRFQTTDIRWNDRLIYDGTWGEANLYNFFFKTIDKIRNTLENKFELHSDSISRSDDSDMIIAIREALVNSIIHCDFKSTFCIKITRLHHCIIFENGGNLRIPKRDFFLGGHSDPRNNTIQDIFRYIKLCERAGSGIPKIMQVVDKYALKVPLLDTSNDIVKVTLWDTTLSDNASDLNDIERDILHYIYINKDVKRVDIERNFKINKADAIKYLNSIQNKGYIKKVGVSRATSYLIKNDEDLLKYEIFNLLKSIF